VSGDRIEIAHFTARNFGQGTIPEPRGFLQYNRNSGFTIDHIYGHDIRLSGINMDRTSPSESIILASHFIGNNALLHEAWQNIDIVDSCGYIARGAAALASGP